MSDSIILKNGDKIAIEEGSFLSNVKVCSPTKADMISVWNKFVTENLKSVQFLNTNNEIIGEYIDLTLESETSIVQKDGTILTSFNLREKTELELLRERIEALENGQDVQDGAISDLGEAVSNLSEGEDIYG